MPPPAPESSNMKSFGVAAERQPESWTLHHSRGPEQDSLLQGGLFPGKSFLLVGFGSEAEAQLSMLVKEQGGKVLTGRNRVIADFAVVPQLGCTVEATVDEVVTDTWLVGAQMVLSCRSRKTPSEITSLFYLFITGHVCGEGVCSASLLQSPIYPCSCEGRLSSSQRLRSVGQPVYRSREGVFGGAGQASRSQVCLQKGFYFYHLSLNLRSIQRLKVL